MEARRRAELTGTNRPFGLTLGTAPVWCLKSEVPSDTCTTAAKAARSETEPHHSTISCEDESAAPPRFSSPLVDKFCWWLWRKGHTRSHPELGR